MSRPDRVRATIKKGECVTSRDIMTRIGCTQKEAREALQALVTRRVLNRLATHNQGLTWVYWRADAPPAEEEEA